MALFGDAPWAGVAVAGWLLASACVGFWLGFRGRLFRRRQKTSADLSPWIVANALLQSHLTRDSFNHTPRARSSALPLSPPPRTPECGDHAD